MNESPQVTVENGVARLRLNRAAQRNALDIPTMLALPVVCWPSACQRTPITACC